ncbi:hypothetical protein M427DRAFT_138806 [Gonapodya prolifera JEL478]|uniref:Enkurin domain-containing protein n=1 Tax=Gonapodya prolifera (strain JEL478) TaxID=1344416 RepID=A0A139A2C6_GONPJ|nr:hypothetical protein M427DRAFT_138806 [Gonapodya prolifera JEL478]|eukprot:KXS10901.1 hypothetical protein M427DRAFT_138806 [Gonapodya prolifera JEL478]
MSVYELLKARLRLRAESVQELHRGSKRLGNGKDDRIDNYTSFPTVTFVVPPCNITPRNHFPPNPTMLDAKAIARKQLGGFAIAEIMKPTRGLRDEIVKRGGRPKDHNRENRKRLRELEEVNRRKKEQDAKPPSPMWKMKRFEQVPAKVDSRSNTGSRTPSDGSLSRSRSAEFLGVGEELARELAQMNLDAHGSPKTHSAPANFIKRNVQRSESTPLRLPELKPTRDLRRTTRVGEVPQYLVNRKLEWAEREQQRMEALRTDLCVTLTDGACRSGMVRVSEEEKQETLAFLKQNQEELLDELTRMPIAVTSMAIKRRKKEIDDRLAEIEKGIQLFSQRVVYTKK